MGKANTILIKIVSKFVTLLGFAGAGFAIAAEVTRVKVIRSIFFLINFVILFSALSLMIFDQKLIHYCELIRTNTTYNEKSK